MHSVIYARVYARARKECVRYVCVNIYIYIFFIGKKSSVSENLFIVRLCSGAGIAATAVGCNAS